MCLSVVYEGKKKKDFLAKLPKMVTAWKCVRTRWLNTENNYFPTCFPEKHIFTEGLNIADGEGFHSFKNHKDAQKSGLLPDYCGAIVKVQIPKKSIIKCGLQENENFVTIVSSQIIMPKFRNKSA